MAIKCNSHLITEQLFVKFSDDLGFWVFRFQTRTVLNFGFYLSYDLTNRMVKVNFPDPPVHTTIKVHSSMILVI